ncbi:MAG: hypothetical protein KF788_09860 [Piscinibacter sp.]|nr:hypothetical protein [Piscinibacter sp.]
MFTLAAGQVGWQRLAAGSRIHLERGQGLLHEPPQWLAGRVWQTPVPLQAGQSHRLARGGWVRLDARSALAARIEPPRGPLSYARQAWERTRTAGSATSRPITERAYR